MVVKYSILHFRHRLEDFTAMRYYSRCPHVRETPFGSFYICTSEGEGDFLPGTYFGRVVDVISLEPELAVNVNASPFKPEERGEIERWLTDENYKLPFRPIEYVSNRYVPRDRMNGIGDEIIGYMERNKNHPIYGIDGFSPRDILWGLTEEGRPVSENAVRHTLHNLSGRGRVVKSSTKPLRFKLIEDEDIEKLIESPFA